MAAATIVLADTAEGKVRCCAEHARALARKCHRRRLAVAPAGPDRPRAYLKDGVMKDGRIVARQVRLYVNSGAYCSFEQEAIAQA